MGEPHQLPALHHADRPRRGHRGRPRRGLHPAVGDRVGLRRTQDPPARTPHGAALEVARLGPPGDLGTPVLPLRDPLPDGPGGHPLRARPGPGQLRRRAADHPPNRRPPGRFSPLTKLAATALAGSCSSSGSSVGSTPSAAGAQHRESSKPRCPNGTSNASTTQPGHSPSIHRTTSSKEPNLTVLPLTCLLYTSPSP